MDVRKVTSLIMDVASIAASGSEEKEIYLQTEKSAHLAVTVKVTYGETATAGIRVYILASADGVNFDDANTDDAFSYFEPKFVADEIHQKTVNLDALPRIIKFVVENLDAAVATGAVKLWIVEVKE